LLLNSDIEILPKALDEMVQFMDTHSDAGMINPKQLYPSGELQIQPTQLSTFWVGSCWKTLIMQTPLNSMFLRKVPRRQPDEAINYDEVFQIEWARGACLMIRRAVWEQIGLLDSNFFFGYEEEDYSRRVAMAGWRNYYCPRAVVVHHGSASHKPYGPGIRARVNSGMFYYWEKYGGTVHSLVLRSVVIATDVLAMFLSPGILFISKDRLDTVTKLRAILEETRAATEFVRKPTGVE
jgi:GT2 family glycosyltransferase